MLSFHTMATFFYLVPTVAPKLGSITRISAKEIQVSWSPLAGGDEVAITGYVIKHRPVANIQRRNTEDLAVLIETNETSHVISQLDPRVSYGVSVAAKNAAGRGVFSEEFITDSKL